MIARILIVCDNGKKLRHFTSPLKKNFFELYSAKNLEQAVKIIRKQKIDVVLFSLFDSEAENFFPLFRELCKIIPIIALTEKWQNFSKFDFDLIVDINNCSYETLLRKIELFVNIRNFFAADIAKNIQFPIEEEKKVAFLLFDDTNIINGLSVKNVDFIFGDCLSQQITEADVFVINAGKSKSKKFCAELRLMNLHVPILFYCKSEDNRYFNKLQSIGCTDIIPKNVNKISFSCELNSLAKFKKKQDLYIKRLQEQLYCSLIDATTGVYNRSFLENHIRKYELSSNNVTVFMIDVDKFKSINDKFGHTFADNALNNIAKIIKKNIRSSDIVARYGGDEFIIIMQNVTKPVVIDIATRIKTQIANFRLDNAHFSVSVGVFCNTSCKSIKAAISSADELMYDVKQSGGNAVKICA